MIILADENIEHDLIEKIRPYFEVISIYQNHRGISDLEVSELAKKHNCLLLTEDKDFGELVFTSGQHLHLSVILIRFVFTEREIIHQVLIDLLNEQAENLLGKFTTVTTRKIRIRSL